LQRIWDQYTAARANAQSLSEQIGIFAETGVCPTCGSEPPGGIEAVEALREKMSAEEELSQRYFADYEEGRKLLSKFEESKADIMSQYKDTLDSQTKTDAMIQSLYRTDFDVEEYERLQEAVEQKSAEYSRYAAYTQQQSSYEASKAALEQQKQDLQQAAVAAPENTPTPEEIKAISDRVASLSVERDKAMEIVGRMSALQEQFIELKEEKTRLEEAQKDIVTQLKVKSYLESVAAIMHRDALPKSISRFYYDKLNILLAKYSEELSLPFTLRLDTATYEFMADFADGCKPFFLLSGGQKTIAAWVWHLAVQEKHAERSGLLMMDEPTYGLDTENLNRVQEVLSSIDSYCERADQQLIMVTHEQDLMSSVAQILEVK